MKTFRNNGPNILKFRPARLNGASLVMRGAAEPNLPRIGVSDKSKGEPDLSLCDAPMTDKEAEALKARGWPLVEVGATDKKSTKKGGTDAASEKE